LLINTQAKSKGKFHRQGSMNDSWFFIQNGVNPNRLSGLPGCLDGEVNLFQALKTV
jgi:hypothetical protein